MRKELLQEIKQGNVTKFYKSEEWRKKRKDILKRDNNECQRCKESGRVSAAATVHHIKHLRDRQDLALTDSNLISVCNACHNILHPEKAFKSNGKRRFISKERW